MPLWLGLTLFASGLILIEVVNVFVFDLWSDRVTRYFREKRGDAAKPEYPWTKRTGT
jgi:hypothetical protein